MFNLLYSRSLLLFMSHLYVNLFLLVLDVHKPFISKAFGKYAKRTNYLQWGKLRYCG